MLKVINHDPHLLDKARRSKVKVELCGDCAHLNNTFTQNLKQLEKLEMELDFSLCRIRDKLLEAEKLGRAANLQNKNDSESTGSNCFSNGVEKLEIMKALRKDVMEKTSDKLAQIPPRVSIPKPNTSKKNKFRHSFRSRINLQTVKSVSVSTSHDVQPTEQLPMDIASILMSMSPPPVPVQTPTPSSDMTAIASSCSSLMPTLQTNEDYTCNICGMTFMFRGNLEYHTKMVHNVTIHCPERRKPELNLKANKSKWNCRRCKKVFSRYMDFRQHQTYAHSHVCKQCGLIFDTRGKLRNHRLLEHLRNGSEEVITPDYTTTRLFPVSGVGPNLEGVETTMVKMEPDQEHLTGLQLPFTDTGMGENNIHVTSSNPYNEPKLKCDICHLMVSDISTHLYTTHFSQSGSRLLLDC